jgi:choline transport protein
LLGWQAFIASSSFATGQLIFNCASIQNPDFQATAWYVDQVLVELQDNRLRLIRQSTLMTIAVAAFSAAFNIFLAKRLPMFEGIVLFFHVLGFFIVRMKEFATSGSSDADPRN